MEEQLDPTQFFRINRSDIVNIEFICSVRINEY
jgi:DNA-binding LytR/AlgR family response regulator